MKNIIRQQSLPGYDTSDYIAESIAFLRENEPEEGFFVGFSGGKDSIVSLELCRIAGVTRQRKESMRRWPGIWKAYEHAVKKWWTIRKEAGLRSEKQHTTAERYWQAYLRGFE